jgi:hypothetical protein
VPTELLAWLLQSLARLTSARVDSGDNASAGDGVVLTQPIVTKVKPLNRPALPLDVCHDSGDSGPHSYSQLLSLLSKLFAHISRNFARRMVPSKCARPFLLSLICALSSSRADVSLVAVRGVCREGAPASAALVVAAVSCLDMVRSCCDLWCL